MNDRTEYHHQYYLDNKERLRKRQHDRWAADPVAYNARRRARETPAEKVARKVAREMGIRIGEARKLLEKIPSRETQPSTESRSDG